MSSFTKWTGGWCMLGGVFHALLALNARRGPVARLTRTNDTTNAATNTMRSNDSTCDTTMGNHNSQSHRKNTGNMASTALPV